MTADLELLREFVNTADLEAGEETLSSPAALRDWLAARDLLADGSDLGAGDLDAARQLREALRAFALGHHRAGDEAPRDAAETLERFAARARLTLRTGPRASVHLEPAAGGIDGALGRLLAGVHVAAVEGSWERLKACPWDTCKWAFIDRSKNRSRTWCSMDVCGNRAKARAFRSRQRGAAG